MRPNYYLLCEFELMFKLTIASELSCLGMLFLTKPDPPSSADGAAVTLFRAPFLADRTRRALVCTTWVFSKSAHV